MNTRPGKYDSNSVNQLWLNGGLRCAPLFSAQPPADHELGLQSVHGSTRVRLFILQILNYNIDMFLQTVFSPPPAPGSRMLLLTQP